MKEPTFNGRELLPLSVMEAAHAGDAMAMEQVLRYYEDYINKLCIRTLYVNFRRYSPIPTLLNAQTEAVVCRKSLHISTLLIVSRREIRPAGGY